MVIRFLKELFGFSNTKDIRILMYHQVLPEKEIRVKNDLIISAENLDEQLKYIQKNYNTLFFKELESHKSAKNKIILTFDDGYYGNLKYLIPLLEKHQLKATIFIPTELIQKENPKESRHMMTFEEVKSLNPDIVEIALHSHSHKNYSEMSLEDAEKDLLTNIEVLQRHHINFTKALAYPYGKFPEGEKKKHFFAILEKAGIMAALRIGNNIDSYPWKKKFEIRRIDIKGSDSFTIFKWKLKLGKIKL